jgi:hypothetical protein
MQCSKLDFELGVAATMPSLRVHLQARRTRSVRRQYFALSGLHDFAHLIQGRRPWSRIKTF